MAHPWLETSVYEPLRQRTVQLVRQSVDVLLKDKQRVSLSTITSKSKELDPDHRGISESAILDNQEARAYYEQHRSWRGSRMKRTKLPAGAPPASLGLVKPDRNEQRVRQRYLRMGKEVLTERLITAERMLAEQRERWLSQQDEALTWRMRAEAAETQLKELQQRAARRLSFHIPVLWLKPGVKYLSRDRSPEYARGANEGAPSAQQVVDRWHLLKNLREVLERVLGRVYEALKQRQLASGLPVRARRRRQRSNNEQTASQMARLRREARYEDVVALYQQGMPVLRIAEDLHMSRTTVRKFVAARAFPERAHTLRSKSILDPYIPYLQQRLEQGPVNASQLWRDVREQGFSGSYKVIARWVQAQGWQLRKGRFSQARRIQEPFM